MTYTIYLLDKEKNQSNVTITVDSDAADMALRRLIDAHIGDMSATAVMRKDEVIDQYIRLDMNYMVCSRCTYIGPFINNGQTCPHCRL